MENLLTQISIVNDSTGKKKITYSYETVDENGITVKSNQRKSFLVVDVDLQTIVTNLETVVTTAMNAQ